ncbi:hypothetical protein GCM10010168_63290 [Actinoplanes ianthinogenes]|uniref:Uncharacterized protein n=1 Tax=Actinoplanes ianthinogenes TaxID=122358 RepID=A0ABM7LJV4_9ACTN|nr:hypothetical protein [Actinoplanes ianthinogenes]BCJ39423.1 hypothetical protein Aiant_00800 [Actinoplanes ianthinogenes]GGR36211.1 hypothetical protein GCM10010168_63290 [Actinoplanes ianthinogenes]
MNVPPPTDGPSARRGEYEQGQEALARFKGALKVCQHRPYLEREVPAHKIKQLKEAIRNASVVLRHVGYSSVESLADLLSLLDTPHVKYEDIFVELADIVELVAVGLQRYRQRYVLDARTSGRDVLTSRLPPEAGTEPEPDTADEEQDS